MLAPNLIIDRVNTTWSTEIRGVDLMRFIIDVTNFDWSDLKLIDLGVKSHPIYCVRSETDAILKLADKVKKPKTIGRYKTKDLNIFSQDELMILRKFGYKEKLKIVKY